MQLSIQESTRDKGTFMLILNDKDNEQSIAEFSESEKENVTKVAKAFNAASRYAIGIKTATDDELNKLTVSLLEAFFPPEKTPGTTGYSVIIDGESPRFLNNIPTIYAEEKDAEVRVAREQSAFLQRVIEGRSKLSEAVRYSICYTEYSHGEYNAYDGDNVILTVKSEERPT